MTAGNASLGKSKQSNEAKEESVVSGSKADENSTIAEVPLLETVLSSELEEMVNPVVSSSTNETNGQQLPDIFPLPLPPTPPSVCCLHFFFSYNIFTFAWIDVRIFNELYLKIK